MKTVREALDGIGYRVAWEDADIRWLQRWAKKHGVAKHGTQYAFTDKDIRAMQKELGFK